MDDLKFNIWTGEVTDIDDQCDYVEDSSRLGPQYFFVIDGRQEPVFDRTGKYIGMIYNGVFFNRDMIDDLWYDTHAPLCSHCGEIKCCEPDQYVNGRPVCQIHAFPRDAIEDVVDYLWNDEERDYEECGYSDHIFLRLVEIAEYLRGVST